MPSLVATLGGTQNFGENVMPRTDDGSQVLDLRSIFGANALKFFGTTYNYLSINTNGNVTLSNSATQTLNTYTPFGMATSASPIIAPFFADVDTRQNSSATVTASAGGTSKGTDLVYWDVITAGNGKLTVTWDDVGYYSGNTNRLNAFQLEIVGQGSGNFDIVFRYESIDWTTGDWSGGVNGLGGTPARVGYSAGNGSNWFEVAGSGTQDPMLALETTLGNTNLAGLYQFAVRNAAALADSTGGTSGDDLLSGGAGNDRLSSFAGNDFLIGNGGADTLVGGTGNDYYSIDATDTLVEAAGAGTDTVISEASYTLAANLENLRLAGGRAINGTGNGADNVLAGNTANNVLHGAGGFDMVSCGLATAGVVLDLALAGPQVLAGLGSDTLVGIEGVYGSMFGDVLKGTAGVNVLEGGLGNDSLYGRGGDDRLAGGAGADRLLGGGGADLFRYAAASESTVATGGRDLIRDFVRGLDRIDLSAMDAKASTLANEAFTFIGTAAFTAGSAAGQVRYTYDSTLASCILWGSTDSDDAPEFAIRLAGIGSLSAADLLL